MTHHCQAQASDAEACDGVLVERNPILVAGVTIERIGGRWRLVVRRCPAVVVDHCPWCGRRL